MKKITTFILVLLLSELSFVASAAEVILGPATKKIDTVNVIPSTTVASEIVFTRTLTIGSSGRDVMALKKILGLEFNTKIDTTQTFTSNTSVDVKKLQEKYAVEILIPNGLSSGTGTVGPSTIKKLNLLASAYSIKLSDFTLPVVSTVRSVITSTLKLGSVGDEVSLLKIVLNYDKETKITPDSSAITNVFDLATQASVNKFQEKYASEILAPSGLTKGIGTVGPSTRKKLNSILNIILDTAQTTNTTSAGSGSAFAIPMYTGSSNQTNNSNNSYTIYINTNTNPSDGDIVSQVCDGTTLITKKVGFSSTYDTRTLNSSQCPSRSSGNNLPVVPSDTSNNTVTPSDNTNNTPNVGDIISQTCSGTTLVTKKAGFNSTYDTRTLNSSLCSGGTLPYTPSVITPNNYVPVDATTKIIKSFAFPRPETTETVIDESTHTIIVYTPPTVIYKTLKFGDLIITVVPVKGPDYDLSSISPEITFQGASILPDSWENQDFTRHVKYTVTAQDRSTVEYTVTATPVKCTDYFTKGVDVAGKVLKTKKVHIIGGFTISGATAYLITADVRGADTIGSKVMNQYCGTPGSVNFVSLTQPIDSASLLGTIGDKFVKINTCPNGYNDTVGGCYDSARMIVNMGFSQ